MAYHSGNQLIDPHLVCQKAGLAPGMRVADFGSGRTGNFVFPAAVIVGEKGSVYAVDIMKPSLEGLMKRAALCGLSNVHTVWADIEHPKAIAIPAHSLDAVFLINFLSAIKNHALVMEEADRLLKPQGRMLPVDWKRAGLPFAPPKADLVPWEAILRWAETHQYTVADDFAVGAYYRGLVLKKSEL